MICHPDRLSTLPDHWACPDCGHRVGAHARTGPSAASCDVCTTLGWLAAPLAELAHALAQLTRSIDGVLVLDRAAVPADVGRPPARPHANPDAPPPAREPTGDAPADGSAVPET